MYMYFELYIVQYYNLPSPMAQVHCMCTYSKFVNYYFCSNSHNVTIPGRGPLDKKGSYNHTTKQQTRKSA